MSDFYTANNDLHWLLYAAALLMLAFSAWHATDIMRQLIYGLVNVFVLSVVHFMTSAKGWPLASKNLQTFGSLITIRELSSNLPKVREVLGIISYREKTVYCCSTSCLGLQYTPVFSGLLWVSYRHLYVASFSAYWIAVNMIVEHGLTCIGIIDNNKLCACNAACSLGNDLK